MEHNIWKDCYIKLCVNNIIDKITKSTTRTQTGIVPKGLRIKKAPAFEPVSKDFYIRWDEILYNAEKNLIELLLYESSKVEAKLEVDLSNGIRELYPDSCEDNRLEMERNEEVYSKSLKKED